MINIHKLTHIFKKYSYQNIDTKSGSKVNIYLNLRDITSNPDDCKKVISALIDKIQVNHPHVNYICGVAYGSMLLSSQLAYELSLPVMTLRKEQKSYGTKELYIAGPRDLKNTSVLIIEDVITTGGSVLHVVEQLAHSGITVAGVVSLFCHNPQMVEKLFKDKHIPYSYLLDNSHIV